MAISEYEQEEDDKESGLRILFGRVLGLWFLRDDWQWPSVGQWQIEFVPTYRSRPGVFMTQSKVIYRWRFTAENKMEAIEQFKTRALASGMERVTVTGISQVESFRTVERSFV